MNTVFSKEILVQAYARAQHAVMSGNPVLEDYAVRSLITAEEYAEIRTYILENKVRLAAGKSFPNDNITLKYITEQKLAPEAVSGVKFCEDMLKSAVCDGVSQYVIVGAGLDTFAFREKALAGEITVFEIDLPQIQAVKKERLKRAGMEIPGNLKFVSSDFGNEDFWQGLEKEGFDCKKKAFFNICGAQPSDVIEILGKRAAEGSGVVAVCKEGNEAEKLFKENGFKTETYLTSAEMTEKYFPGNDAEISSIYIYATLSGKKEKIIKQAKPELPTPVKKIQTEPVQERKKVAVRKRGPGGTKEIILKTALRLFGEKGFEAVSVRDIAGEIGITQAALYKHYTNKKDIFDSILNFMEMQADEMAENLPEQDKLMGYFRYWAQEQDAVLFRRMLTIEQYADSSAAQMFENYFTTGAVEYVKKYAKSGVNAFESWAVIFLMINMHDTAEDKEKIIKMAEKYISNCGKA